VADPIIGSVAIEWSRARLVALAGVFAAAAAITFWLSKPLDGGPAAPDAASSVLFFDRLVSGQHLEAWLNTTPKPLMTVVLGGLHAMTGDWRAGALASVLVTGLGVALAVELVRRIAGPEAGIFAGVSLVGLVSLQAEASWSYGMPWAFALWMAAGLALTRPKPRYGLAGLFLLLASLTRPETFILLGVALLILGFTTLARRGPRLPGGAWLLMVGWLAVVGYCVHDLLLTGDPLWWTKVASRSVELNHGSAHSLNQVILSSRLRLLSMLPLALAASAGGLLLLRRRAWMPAAALIALGPLVIVETWVLAARRVNVLSHYYHPVDVAIVLGASVAVGAGLAWLRARSGDRLSAARGRAGLALSGAAAVVLAIALARPFAPLSAASRTSLAREANIASRLGSLEPTLASLVSSDEEAQPPSPGPMTPAADSTVRLFVPTYRVGRLAVDLKLPLTEIAALAPGRVNLALGYPQVGSIVYLDGNVYAPSAGPKTAVLQVSQPTVTAGIRIVPIKVDPEKRIWIVRIESAQ
jgi:hypothetical protein